MTTTTETARLVLEVTAGVIPGKPEPDLTRQYALTSSQWAQAGEDGIQLNILAELNGKAQGYAAALMLQPDRYNFVRVDWLWL
jgi:hypothetical protein